MSMEDKTFELMTRMYSEFSELKNEFIGLKSDVKDLKSDVIGLKSDVKGLKNDVIRIENKLDNNSKALFDGYNQLYEEVADIKKTMNEISSKVEKQDVEIRVIKGGASNA